MYRCHRGFSKHMNVIDVYDEVCSADIANPIVGINDIYLSSLLGAILYIKFSGILQHAAFPFDSTEKRTSRGISSTDGVTRTEVILTVSQRQHNYLLASGMAEICKLTLPCSFIQDFLFQCT
jgi:hypothetical protein